MLKSAHCSVHCSLSCSATPGGVCTIAVGELYKSVDEKQTEECNLPTMSTELNEKHVKS